MDRQPAKHKEGSIVRLGEVIGEFMGNQVSRRQAELYAAEELLNTALPSELLQHCKIAGISGRKLLVQVDSPSYMYEMQLASDELLKQMRQQCPRGSIEKIKLILA